MKIKKIEAYEILDSRGNPTVKCRVVLDDGSIGEASVPSGASTGRYEALELRDGDPKRYGGKGVLKAVENVNKIISPKLIGLKADEQEKIDQLMIDLDGTENKAKLGANAILSVSLAVSRTAADSLKMPLYRYLRKLFNSSENSFSLPIPMVKLFDGGKHANNNLDIQEFLILPIGAHSLSQAVQMVAETFHHLGVILNEMGFSTTVGDEGGYAPNLKSNTETMDLMMKAIKEAGYIPGKEISLALDCAATSFYQDKKYFLRAENKSFSSQEMIKFYARWVRNYPLISIEDGLSEDDWQGWQALTKKLGKNVQVVGDDLFVTNVSRIEKGIGLRAANATLIKFNQIGTLSETFAAIRKTYEVGWMAVISHRSGETEDTFMADLAVATNGSQIKTGVCRSERVAKYNRLLEIERELKGKAKLSSFPL